MAIPIGKIWTEQSVTCHYCHHRESEMDIPRGKFQKILSKAGFKMRDGNVICPECFKKKKHITDKQSYDEDKEKRRKIFGRRV